MAKRGANGSIILTTEVDTSGIKKGTHDIKGIADETGQAFRNLSNTVSKALAQGDTKTAQLANNFQKATAEVEKQAKKVNELKKHLAQLKSGEISVNSSSVKKLQTDFDKTTESVKKTQVEVNSLYFELDKLRAGALQVPSGGNLENGTLQLTPEDFTRFNEINAKLDELEPRLEANKQKAAELGVALKEAVGTAAETEIDKTKIKLGEAEIKLSDLGAKAEIAGQKLENGLNKTKKQTSEVSDSFGKMSKKLYSLARGALIFSAITKGFTSLRENITSALMSNDNFRQSIYQLQAALWTVSEPIYQAILPALQKMIRWLTIGVLYIATFFSALGGKTLKQTIASAKALNKQAQAYNNISNSSSKSTANTKKASKSMKDLAKQTKEANKELAAFDDLMILQEKTMDEISTPTSGTGIDGGIQSGFEDLENLLNDSDMENLNKFQEWVSNNRNSIITALEIAGLGALGFGIGKVISKIGELLGWFNKKDKALDTQTGKTKQETSAVNEMSNAFSFAKSPVFSLSGALSGLTASALGLIPQLNGATSSSYGLAPAFDTITNSALNSIPSINGVETALYGVDNAAVAVENQIKTSMPVVESNVSGAFNNAAQNVSSFLESKHTIYDWCLNVNNNIKTVTSNLATNIYQSLNSASINISDFVNDASSNIAQWSENVANNAAISASRFATNWGEAIRSAWNNFKDFMSATGEKVSGFWHEHKATIITVGALTGLAVAGIALAPYTGGASLALPALAKGGIVPYATTAVIGEAGKEAVLPLENNTEWMDILADKIAIRNGTSPGSTTVVLEIDGREFGRAVVEQGNKETRRIGTRLVIA